MKPHFTALEAAYQLHYYLWFKTHYLQPQLADLDRREFARVVISDVCKRNEYSLLESDIDPTHLRLLLSLQPRHSVAQAVKLLKGNLQHQFGKTFGPDKLLARGYFARTSGRVDLERSRAYVDSQVRHHGYSGQWTKPLKFCNDKYRMPAFSFDHCVAILNYHLVFATQNRIHLFDEAIAPNLFNYILAVGAKHKLAIDRIGLLPDHLHMIVEGIPGTSIEEYALAILNNTRDWMTKKYSGVLKETKAWDVWQPSFYAGSVGEFTTTQVSSFLARRD